MANPPPPHVGLWESSPANAESESSIVSPFPLQSNRRELGASTIQPPAATSAERRDIYCAESVMDLTDTQRPPGPNSGWALCHDDCYQGAPATLVTTSILAEVQGTAGSDVQGCLYCIRITYRSQHVSNSLDPVLLPGPRVPTSAPPVRHADTPAALDAAFAHRRVAS
jgi:hypothetical protein